jgi:hypothetical protein
VADDRFGTLRRHSGAAVAANTATARRSLYEFDRE